MSHIYSLDKATIKILCIVSCFLSFAQKGLGGQHNIKSGNYHRSLYKAIMKVCGGIEERVDCTGKGYGVCKCMRLTFQVEMKNCVLMKIVNSI